MTNRLELIQKLREFLSVNRQYLTGEEIKLLDGVINELKKVDKSPLNLVESLLHLATICELLLKLFKIN